jgi:hypothetical protein
MRIRSESTLIADPDADLDPAYHIDADPDLSYHFNAEADPCGSRYITLVETYNLKNSKT